jgi:hypothetical protein
MTRPHNTTLFMRESYDENVNVVKITHASTHAVQNLSSPRHKGVVGIDVHPPLERTLRAEVMESSFRSCVDTTQIPHINLQSGQHPRGWNVVIERLGGRYKRVLNALRVEHTQDSEYLSKFFLCASELRRAVCKHLKT